MPKKLINTSNLTSIILISQLAEQTANSKTKKGKSKQKNKTASTKNMSNKKAHKIKSKERPKVTKRPVPKKPEKDSEIPDELKWVQEDPQEHLLSRFVETPKGTQLGESIGIEKNKLLIKNKLNFYSIPLNSVKEKGQKLVLRRKINWKRAAKIGESWRKRTLDVIKPKPTTKPTTKPTSKTQAKPKSKRSSKQKLKTKKAKQKKTKQK